MGVFYSSNSSQVQAAAYCAISSNDLGVLEIILNMEITRMAGGGLFLSQSLCVNGVLKRFADHFGAKPTKCRDYIIPIDHKIKFHMVGAINLKFNECRVETEKNGERVPPNTPYREVFGSWHPYCG